MKLNFLILPFPEYILAATGQTREKYIQPRRKVHLDFENSSYLQFTDRRKTNNRKNTVK